MAKESIERMMAMTLAEQVRRSVNGLPAITDELRVAIYKELVAELTKSTEPAKLISDW